MKDFIIAIDFDGTCVTHEYPKIGKNIGAENVLKEFVENGIKLILWTMRSGEYLEDALNWFKEHEIPLYGVNENPEQKSWTSSPKAYAKIYIDDAALGAPLKMDNSSLRPYIDWDRIYEMFFTNKRVIRELEKNK